MAIFRTYGLLLIASSLLYAAPADETARELEGHPIEKIRITGLRAIRESYVRSILASKEGLAFSLDSLARDRSRLERLGVFTRSSVEARSLSEGVALDVEAQEGATFLLYPSFEISDENGVSAGPGIKTTSLFGFPLSLSAAGRFGGATNIELTALTPPVPGSRPWMTLDFFQRDRVNQLDMYKEKASEVDFSLGKYWGDHFRYGGTVKFVSMRGDRPEATLTGARDYVAGAGGILGYDTRDSWFGASNGWWNEFEATRYFGDSQFWRVRFDVRRYLPIADQHTLALFSLTTLQTGKVGEDIPVYLDFHLGGTNTIRGWGLDARGGKNQTINTIEYRWNFLKSHAVKIIKFRINLGLQLAVFGDVGTAWSDSDHFSKNFIGGYGVGLRVLLPFVDMVRFDLGFGQSGRGIDFHLGVREKALEQLRRVR